MSHHARSTNRTNTLLFLPLSPLLFLPFLPPFFFLPYAHPSSVRRCRSTHADFVRDAGTACRHLAPFPSTSPLTDTDFFFPLTRPAATQHNCPAQSPLAAHTNHNTLALPASPNAHSLHPPGNKQTPCTQKGREPFGMMHNQTASQVCRLPTPSSSSPSAPSALGATGTPCRSFSAQPHAPGTTNTTHYVRGSTRPSAPETVAPPCAASGSTTAAATRSTITCTTAQDAAVTRDVLL